MKANVKKELYSAFISIGNMSVVNAENTVATNGTNLRNLPTFVKTDFIVGTGSISNSNGDSILCNGTGNITGTITDNKVRVLTNISGTNKTIFGQVTNPGYSVIAQNDQAIAVGISIVPVGGMLAEPQFTYSKGDGVKINNGDDVVTESTLNINFIIPDLVDDLRNLLYQYSTVGILLLSKSPNKSIYANSVVPFVSLNVKSNALSQTEINIDKSDTLIMANMLEG